MAAGTTPVFIATPKTWYAQAVTADTSRTAPTNQVTIATGGAGTLATTVAIQRLSDGAWWNGSGSIFAGPVVYNATTGTALAWEFSAIGIFASGAQYRVVARITDTLGPTEYAYAEFTYHARPTLAGLDLIDDADAAAQRTTLGLSTLATAEVGSGLSLVDGVLSASASASPTLKVYDALSFA